MGWAAVRDPRAINSMEPEIKRVHILLERWGQWSKGELRAWPTITLAGRIIEQGPAAAAIKGFQSYEADDDIAAIDSAVARLKQPDRQVVETYYQMWLPVQVLSRRLRMTETRYASVLRRARWTINGYLLSVNV